MNRGETKRGENCPGACLSLSLSPKPGGAATPNTIIKAVDRGCHHRKRLTGLTAAETSWLFRTGWGAGSSRSHATAKPDMHAGLGLTHLITSTCSKRILWLATWSARGRTASLSDGVRATTPRSHDRKGSKSSGPRMQPRCSDCVSDTARGGSWQRQRKTGDGDWRRAGGART